MQIRFLGQLKDVAGVSETNLRSPGDLKSLRNLVMRQYPELGKYSFLTAVNKRMQNENIPLNENDAVSFVPPYSGG